MAHILIDGYNLIRTTTLLGSRLLSLEKERQELIRQLAAYKRIKGHRVTVVFDATKTEYSSISEGKEAGIHYVYTKGGQTADEVLMMLARKLGRAVVVVSSDQAIISTARQAGAGVLTSPEFADHVRQASHLEENPFGKKDSDAKKNPHKRWITQKKGPSKRLPKSKRRALEKL